MDTSSQFKQSMQELARRLRVMMMAGYVAKGTYDLGIQVLARMVNGGTTEVVATWEQMAGTLPMLGQELWADAPPTTRYEMYQALQELEEKVGLFSHVTREGLDEQVADAAKGSPRGHFTKTPGVDSHIIGEKTMVIFRYEEWLCRNLDVSVARYLESAQLLRLPKWLAKGPGVSNAVGQS